jgi:hypothetical protein
VFVKSLRQQWRLVWCCGISVVLFAAVIPYPIHGLIGGSDLVHRIHDTVGSIQYLPLWAVPVFAYGFVRKSEYLYIAALAAVAVFVTGVWSSTLIASASWMQLATLVPLLERRALEPMKMSWHMIPAAMVAGWCTVVFSNDLMTQHAVADGMNTHALRFHYSGMAAAYMAMALCALFASMWKVGRLTTALIGGSFISTGLLCLFFSSYESALNSSWSQAFLASGIVALVGLRR